MRGFFVDIEAFYGFMTTRKLQEFAYVNAYLSIGEEYFIYFPSFLFH